MYRLYRLLPGPSKRDRGCATGRGGTCELMIGCIAKATSDTLHMDESEMDDVRWVSRDQLKLAVEDSKRTDTPYQGELLAPSCTSDGQAQTKGDLSIGGNMLEQCM